MSGRTNLCIFILVTFILMQNIDSWSGHVCTRMKLNYYRHFYCGCRIWGWCLYNRYLTRGYYSYENNCCPGWTYTSYRVCSSPVCSPGCRNGGKCIDPNVCSCAAGYDGDICDGRAACSHVSPCYPGRCSGGGQCVCSANFTGGSCLTCGEYVANTEEYICQHTSDTNPIANTVFECRLHNVTNIIQLDSGDKYTLTYTVKTGGFRELVNPDTNVFHSRETYSGVYIQNVMEYRFDCDIPEHCIELNNCGPDDVPLKIDKDVSKGPFTTYWKGWTDGSLSGIKRYALEFWKMEYSKDYDGLREPDILTDYNPAPQYIVEVNENDTIYYPEYQPTEPGVYSVILEVADAANNSRYARQIVMYDNTSEISLNVNHRLYATSASPEADHVWQTTPNSDDSATTTIKITWQNHFINYLHQNNHFLSKILDYNPRLSDNSKRVDYKKIDSQFDDTDSVRNKSAIHNINSIIQFETVHGTKSNVTPVGWQIVNPLKQDVTFVLSGINIRSGDSYQVWVRARDIMGNSKVDSTVIYFDSSGPNVFEPSFQPNVNDGKYAFSSRITVSARDQESGIRKVSIKFIINSTGEITEQRDFDKAKELSQQCESKPKECYCISKGECFLIDTIFDIDNCWLKVPLERVTDENHRLDITVYNMAMIPNTTTYNIGLGNSFHGIRDYFGPSNITIHDTTDSSLSISWVEAPTCYERAEYLITLFRPDNSTTNFKVHKDATTFDLTGLQATTKYRLELNTKYGNESYFVMSIASGYVQFNTTGKQVGIGAISAEVGILPSTIGGISAGVIILLVVVVIVLVWRAGNGRVHPDNARDPHRIRTMHYTVPARDRSGSIIRGVNNRAKTMKIDDEMYYNGRRDVHINNSLVVSRKDVSLESQLAQGRFATIYLAKYYGNQRDVQTVVAKVLKDNQNEDNIMKMKAKIKFYTEKVGHHKNVMDFIGSVQNDVRGPFMVLEYCENGVLKEFLISCKSNVTVDLEEKLFRMVFGVCLGMDYLSSKQVVHRMLAARNIFLDHIYEPKIAGFGPGPTGEKVEKRIPKRWMAPESMKSTRHANELSDVFSFGVVMWEIFSLGDTPYPGIRSRDVLSKQKQGYTMKKPEYADDAFYKIMLNCWHYDPHKRVGFAQIKEQLSSMFSEGPEG